MAACSSLLRSMDNNGEEDSNRKEAGPEMNNSGMNEACGLFGVVANGEWPTELDVPQIIHLGLIALQHRGQESAGIVTSKGDNNGSLAIQKGNGLVSSIFTEEHMLKLKGNMGIGHTRYSTMGGTDVSNCQPFVVYNAHGMFTMAHNGELINSQHVRKMVLKQGVGLTTNSDSELITQLLSRPPPIETESDGLNWPARVRHLMEVSPTAYSLLIMHGDKIYGIRDPFGNRPLCLGRIMLTRVDSDKPANEESDGWVVSSESCAFQSIGAKYIRDVEPGEIVELSRHGIRSIDIVARPKNKSPAFCIFEYVYFARPDSTMEGQNVYKVRFLSGMQLAKEAPADADIVSTIPESATPAAMGFAQQSGIRYSEVLCKNRYVGRTFIQPNSRLRQLSVAKKFGVLADNCRGKRIVLVDDSIVRGTTIGPIIRMLKENGALEVHIRIASPPIKNPCYMGINIPTSEELIANRKDADQIARDTGASSLVHLSVEGLLSAVQKNINRESVNQVGHCTACLTNKYPVALDW